MIPALMKTYSQNGEDLKIFEIVERHARDYDGSLLDIGAWHATQLSNSRLLIEAGWGGVLIEPSPGPMHGLVKEYGLTERVTLVSAAVVVDGSRLVKLDISDDAVSTSHAGVHELWKDSGGYFGELWVPAITLQDIWNQFGGFQFVNVDAEGSSVEIARAYLDSGQQPICMCVEHDSRIVELMSIAQSHGYRAAHVNDTNVILELI